MATKRQTEYLEQLVVSHPNFIDRFNQNTWDCTEEDAVQWLMDKYLDKFMEKPIKKLSDLSVDEASALISHLELRPTRKTYLDAKAEGKEII